MRRKHFHLTKEEIAMIPDLLREHRGNLAAVSRALGVNRRSITDHLNKRPEWKLIREDAMHSAIDNAESNLFKLAEDGNLGAIIFLLKTQGRERGYVERREITLPDPRRVIDALRQASPEQRSKIRERLESGEDVGRVIESLDVTDA